LNKKNDENIPVEDWDMTKEDFFNNDFAYVKVEAKLLFRMPKDWYMTRENFERLISDQMGGELDDDGMECCKVNVKNVDQAWRA